jgi:hypothetical protein
VSAREASQAVSKLLDDFRFVRGVSRSSHRRTSCPLSASCFGINSSLAVTERYAHVGERDLRAAITTLS